MVVLATAWVRYQPADTAIIEVHASKRGSRTYSDELLVVVQGHWRVLLYGRHIQRRPKSHHKEQSYHSGDLARHRWPVDAIETPIMDVVRAVDFPERQAKTLHPQTQCDMCLGV